MAKIKRVFSSTAEVCHVWASRSQDSGRAGNVFFEDDTIYSYGRHFPLATFRKMPNGETVVLFTADSYSVSTAKHICRVQEALYGLDYKVVTLPAALWKDDYRYRVFGRGDSPYILGKGYFLQQIADTFKLSSRARDHAFMHCLAACRLIQALKLWGRLHRRKAVYSFTDADRAIICRAIGRKRTAADRAAAKEARRQEQIAADMIELEKVCGGSIVDYWHKHGRLPAKDWSTGNIRSMYDLPTMCRLSDDRKEVITSRGARVPTEHAKRLLPLILRARRQNKAYKIPPEKPIRIGHYVLNEISETGDVRIGCHLIKWVEVEYIGRELGLIN